MGELIGKKFDFISIKRQTVAYIYVVVQFLLWNNLFLNWDKIVWTGTKYFELVQNILNWYNFNCTGANSENSLIYEWLAFIYSHDVLNINLKNLF